MKNQIEKNILEGSETPDLFLFGERGSGKDTVADWLVENAGYVRFSFGDEIRKIVKMFGVDPKREHLVGVTEMAYKLFGEKVWINLATHKFKQFKKMNEGYGVDKPIVITDMRYPDIYEHFLLEGFYPVHVVSKHEDNIQRVIGRDGYYPEKLKEDRSEKHYQSFKGYRLYNDTNFEGLYEQIKLMLFLFGEKETYETSLEYYQSLVR
jgi:dephospho-CoA kinase